MINLNNFLTLTTVFALIGCSGGPFVESEVANSSCSVSSVDGGALISCPDGSQQVVLNGNNGVNGTDGVDGADGQDAVLPDTSVVEIIDPCGPSGGFDEILLALADGSIVAYFAGVSGFLTVLKCGRSYVTTDAEACSFKLDNECNYVEN